jgi:hypothetical protein
MTDPAPGQWPKLTKLTKMINNVGKELEQLTAIHIIEACPASLVPTQYFLIILLDGYHNGFLCSNKS